MRFLGKKQDPISPDGECRNTNQEDRFTCPGCYADLPRCEGVHECADCEAMVVCLNEAPIERDSVARMIGADDIDRWEDELEDANYDLEELRALAKEPTQ